MRAFFETSFGCFLSGLAAMLVIGGCVHVEEAEHSVASVNSQRADSQLVIPNTDFIVTIDEATPVKLDQLGDGDTAKLDFMIEADAFPLSLIAAIAKPLGHDCDYGPMKQVREVAIPTGSNHLLVTIDLGSAERFPANLVSCDYTPGFASGRSDEGPPTRIRLRGCFYVREISIPTARLLDLAPLPGAACGLHG